MDTLKLNSGHEIPTLGLGTWQAKEDAVYQAVLHALNTGYRHIDTAAIYDNEAEVGRALAESPVPAEEVFVTTKIWNTNHTYEATSAALDESLGKLGLETVDLVLIHWPGSYERNWAVYRALQDAVEQGKVRSIGVSNFSIHHLTELMREASITPAANQVECHVRLQNVRLQEFCQSHQIALEAYAPLMSWEVQDLLEIEELQAIAQAHGKTVAQVALRWLIQRDVIALPKSVNPGRIDENHALDFSLSADDMATIRRLNKGKRLFPEPDNIDFGFLD